MENMMLTAKILWRNKPSGVLFKVRWNSWRVSNFWRYGIVNLSVCCCFGARPLKFGIRMLVLVSSIQINIDSI